MTVGLVPRATVYAVIGLVLVAWAASRLRAELLLTERYLIVAPLLFLTIAAVALVGIGHHHPFARPGTANVVTGGRAMLTALVAAALLEGPTPSLAWVLVALATVAVSVDGVDGWVARREGLGSPFGARFDMEVDAALILALSALAWRFDKTGAWVLASGLMRYAFVAAGFVWPWFDRPLPPSRRRQVVCVVQIAGLIATLAPIVPRPFSAWIAGGSLVALTWSFWLDVRWLVVDRH